MFQNFNIAPLEELFILLKNPVINAPEQIRLDGSHNPELALIRKHLIYRVLACELGFQLFLELKELFLIIEIYACKHLSSFNRQDLLKLFDDVKGLFLS